MRYLALLMLILTLGACGAGDGTTSTPPPAAAETTTAAPDRPAPVPARPAPLAAGDQLYPWVDNVNVRERPATDARIITRVAEGQALEFTGQQTDDKTAVVLRGVVYEEPWLEVVAPNNEGTGWVHGGTVKRANEKKGNPVITDTKFQFPHFGTYDLTDWEQMPNVAHSGGDATIVVQTYERDGTELTIDRTHVGEYGYTHTYTFRDPDGNVALERTLKYDAVDDRTLTETVTNHIEKPAVRYVRSQKLPAGPLVLGGEPLMVNGEWTKTTLD